MKTIFDPIATGKTELGDTAYQYVASEQGPKHCLIQGMTGSGKTEGEKPVILALAARGAVQMIIDVRKKTQSYGTLAPVIDWLVVDEGVAHAALERLIDNVIPARTAELARTGFSSWSPKSNLRFLRVQIEEAWDFVDSDSLTQASLAARSAGVQLVVSLQRASHDLISTSLRDQLGTIKCYGLKSSWGASILDDDVTDAGANPMKWADEYPGMHYMQQGGLTVAQKATPIRAYTDCGRYKFADEAARLGPDVATMDMVTAAAWGNLWRERTKSVDLMKAVGSVVVSKKHPQRIADNDDRLETPSDDSEETVMDLVTEPKATLTGDGRTVAFGGDARGDKLRLHDDDPDPGTEPDIDMPIADRDPSRPSRRLGDPDAPKADRKEYDALLRARLDKLIEEGKNPITAADFADIVVQCGWSRTTVYKQLSVWQSERLLTRVDDGWIPIKN